jgi:HD-like signal output (HDOD) protein
MPFRTFLAPNKEAAAEPQSALETLKESIGNLNKVPMLPEAANRALAVANDPNSSLQSFAAIIERDPTLAAGILRLANSPLFRVGRSLASLDQAVVRLGLRECQNLIVAVGMRSLFRNVDEGHKRQLERLWRHSFTTACLSRRLARALSVQFQGAEFSGGLAHDIGRILIALGAPEQFDAADPLDFHEGPEVLEREQAVLGTDHCQFGALFANLNQLPGPLVNVIQFHHHPLEAGDHRALVCVVAAADHAANHLERTGTAEGYELEDNRGWALLAAGWPDERRQNFEEQFPGLLAEADKEARDAHGSGVV